MNKCDTFLLDYFKDISTQDSPEISIKAEKLLEGKFYSNINIKDERGNTFAHYCLESFARWFIK